MVESLWYTGNPLDRVSHRRADDIWLEARRRATESRIVAVWRTKNLVHAEEDRALLPTIEEAGDLLREGRHPSLLGIHDGIAYFAVDLSHMDDPYVHPLIESQGAFEDLRQVGPVIPRNEGCILAHARGLMFWHSRHGFCGVCGAPTVASHAGHQRDCTNPDCRASHFPRTDPAVIMLVHRDDMCLLGRTHNFPKGRYSTLAGFVEPGECLEEAVAREVFEETGVVVGEVKYLASQPWPFPASIMLGFHAHAETTDIRIDPKELDDARWYTRDQVINHREAGFDMPRGDSIAFRLIKAWIEGTA